MARYRSKKYRKNEKRNSLASHKPRPLDVIGQEERARFGQKWHRQKGEELKTQLERFHAALCLHIETMLKLMWNQRSSYDFNERWDRNERRARVKPRVEYGSSGEVIADTEDGHCPLHLHTGTSAQGIPVHAAKQYRTLFEMSDDPFDIRIVGGPNDENDAVVRCLRAGLRSILTRSDFIRRAGRPMTFMVPRQGTSIIRYYPTKETIFERQPSGQFEERVLSFTPEFREWPIKDVFVSDYGWNLPEDMELVLWVNRNQTVWELQRQEATWSFDAVAPGEEDATFEPAEGQPVPVRLNMAGRYVNLDALREKSKEAGIAGQTQSQGFETGKNTDTKTSGFPRYTVLEAEGMFPMAALCFNGDLTPEVGKFYGLQMGEDEDEEAWAYRMASVPWRVTVALDEAQNSSLTVPSFTGAMVLEVKEDPYDGQKNSLYRFVDIEDGRNFLGHSGVDLSRGSEDAADMMLNNVVLASAKNARPNRIISTSKIKNSDDRDVGELQRKLMGVDEIIEVENLNGVKVSDLLAELFTQEDPQAFEKIAFLVNQAQGLQQVNAAARSGNTADTLGQEQIAGERAELVLTNISIGNAHEMKRMFKRVLHDCIRVLGPVGFKDFLKQVSGRDAVDLDKYFEKREIDRVRDPVLDLEDQYEVTIPAMTVGDSAVTAATVEKLMENQLLAPFLNIPKNIRTILNSRGIRNAEDHLTEQGDPLMPEQEHEMFKAGHIVKPSPRDNIVEHVMAHGPLLVQIVPWVQQARAQRKQLIQGGQARTEDQAEAMIQGFQPGMSYAQSEMLAWNLKHHWEDTQRIWQALMGQFEQARLFAQADPNAEPGEPGKEGENGNGAKPAQDAGGAGPVETPTDEQGQSAGLAQAAMAGPQV